MRLMDMAAYLREQKQYLGKECDQVKDFSVFDFNYIPQEPVLREECRQLIQEMLRFELSGVPNHIAIIGSRGSGKTLSVRYLQRVVHAETGLNVLYANCRHHNTSFKILAHFLGVQARGASLAELFERFCGKYAGRTVVVLDEIDLMSIKDRRREILYLLSRSERPFMVIMLSNSPQVLKELDAATRSSLQPLPVHFRNYNAEQLVDILRNRASKGLKSFEQGKLAEIAALTTRLTNSDARVAIKTLRYVVTSPEEELTNCFERARRDIVIDLINDLSDATLMVLWAVAMANTDFAKDIYGRYCRFSLDHHEKPFSYVYFYSNLSYLQSVGLVALVSTKQGRTYTNRVLLTFDRSVLLEICNLRFS